MIDCKKTENYLKERKRMCERNQCDECSLGSNSNGTRKTCRVFENCYPDKVMEIIQKWSDEHQQKTYLTEFLKSYPKTELNSDGYPSDIVPCSLGLIKRKDICKNMCLYFYDNGHPCYDCWNTLVEESEVK